MSEYHYDPLCQQILRAREEERKLIARELHDQVIQSLIGLNCQLADIGTQLDSDTKVRVVQLQGHIRHTLSEVRNLCTNLRAPTIDGNLTGVVRMYIQKIQTQLSFELALHIEGEAGRAIPSDIALCVFRVLQEALMNIRKHADARKVEISLLLWPDEICLVVQDDGCGFHAPDCVAQLEREQHFGLLGLRERLDLVRGALRITSSPDNGSRLCAWVPLRAPTADAYELTYSGHSYPYRSRV